MKISPAEIVAASDAFLKNGYLSEALKAAYTVRKQRKAAKRERQRKEKDKQVVESVKPTHFKDNPIAGMSQSEYDEMIKVQAGLMAPKFGASKAPEWDGTFGVGEWEMRNGEKAVVESEDDHDTYPLNVQSSSAWEKSRTKKGQVWVNSTSPEDLIRPWPKGEQ